MQPEAILFEAVISPHRSLSAYGLRLLVAALCLVGTFYVALFIHLGAWPVSGFCGAELVLAIVLLRLNMLSARAAELVILTARGLRIIRTDPRGNRREAVLSPGWLRVQLEERPGRVPALRLLARDGTEEIGASLGEAEKRDLAASLQAALRRWREPIFDNPQLRE
jgi:uncharacterized membrane protein